ncbi:MAG: hypothetical protein IH583_02110, partial [Candidatus Aminicenantes bacterium]|nr:hypothetical protein [Candidatus Aminicenantes bacterium]
MKSNPNKTLILAVVALGLALYACADSGRQKANDPGIGTPVSEASPPPIDTRSQAASSPGTGTSSGPMAGNAQAAPAPTNAQLTEDERNTIGIVRET